MNAQERDPAQVSGVDGPNDTTSKDVDTIATIVVEVRDTAGTASAAEIQDMLRQRLEEASVDINDAEIQDLTSQIREGSEATG